MPLTDNASYTYEYQNGSGLMIMGYGLGQDESYYYMAAASARQLDPAFYVNDLHFQDINGQSICDADLVFRASIQYPLGTGTGRLRWFIDNVERTSVQDMNTWTMPKGQLLGTHTIKLTIRDSYNQTKDVVTTFTVLAIPTAIPAANVSAASICSGTAPTVTVTGTSSSLTYRVFNALTGGTQVGSVTGNGGTINIPCTGNLSASTTYYVESYNGVCPSTPRTPVTVNVVARPTVPTLSAAAVCNGSNPVIHLASSVSGVNYNVYTASSGGTNVGSKSGTGSAIDITLTTTPSSTTTYYVEAALGSCLSTSRSSVSVTVNPKPSLALSNITVTAVSCYGESTGSISVSASGVTGYSKDNGTTWQTGSTFTGLAAGSYSIRVRTSAGCVSDAVSATVSQPATALNATSSVANVLCNGGNGTITVTATGGTPSYQYKLGSGSYQSSNSFSVAAGTNYSITVKDANGCEKALTGITVTQPAVLTATATVTDLTCNGGVPDGKITISASGGVSAYQYSIDGGSTYQSSNTFENLGIGAYGVVVKDANNCSTAMQTVHVSQPLIIEIPTPAVTDVTCNGGDNGSITVSGVSGGTAPYTYSFDNGINYSTGNTKSGLSAGTYNIRVKDNSGCVSSSVTATVAEQGVLLTLSDVSAAISCPNLPATITIANTLMGVNYEIYSVSTGGTYITFAVGNGTAMDVNIGVISETAVFYIETSYGGCVSVSRVPVTVPVRQTMLNYPDIRIEVCPGITNVNLSKYIDTVDLQSLTWTGWGIDSNTGIIGSVPATPSIYTLKYSASSHCAALTERIVYLHVVKDKKIFAPRDTVAVCWKYAGAMQINQLFGVEAGGTWSTVPVLTDGYIHQSPSSSPYAGALVFNGKSAYEDGILPAITYHGEPSRKIEFYYTVSADNCLGYKEYKVVIVLTPDIMQ
jgi:hypothetical protein